MFKKLLRIKSKQCKNKEANNKMMRILILKSHWTIKKGGLKFLKTKRKLKNNKTVISMINKVGLPQIITQKRWLKSTQLMSSKK